MVIFSKVFTLHGVSKGSEARVAQIHITQLDFLLQTRYFYISSTFMLFPPIMKVFIKTERIMRD